MDIVCGVGVAHVGDKADHAHEKKRDEHGGYKNQRPLQQRLAFSHMRTRTRLIRVAASERSCRASYRANAENGAWSMPKL